MWVQVGQEWVGGEVGGVGWGGWGWKARVGLEKAGRWRRWVGREGSGGAGGDVARVRAEGANKNLRNKSEIVASF